MNWLLWLIFLCVCFFIILLWRSDVLYLPITYIQTVYISPIYTSSTNLTTQQNKTKPKKQKSRNLNYSMNQISMVGSFDMQTKIKYLYINIRWSAMFHIISSFFPLIFCATSKGFRRKLLVIHHNYRTEKIFSEYSSFSFWVLLALDVIDDVRCFFRHHSMIKWEQNDAECRLWMFR